MPCTMSSGKLRFLPRLKFFFGLLFLMGLMLMICFRCVGLIRLYLQMFVMYCQSLEISNHLFLHLCFGMIVVDQVNLIDIYWICLDNLATILSTNFRSFGSNLGFVSVCRSCLHGVVVANHLWSLRFKCYFMVMFNFIP